jgi:hypothetical protein
VCIITNSSYSKAPGSIEMFESYYRHPNPLQLKKLPKLSVMQQISKQEVIS